METPVCVYLALPAAPCSRSSGVGRGVYSARRARAAGAPPRAARAGRGRRDPRKPEKRRRRLRPGRDAVSVTPTADRRRAHARVFELSRRRRAAFLWLAPAPQRAGAARADRHVGQLLCHLELTVDSSEPRVCTETRAGTQWARSVYAACPMRSRVCTQASTRWGGVGVPRVVRVEWGGGGRGGGGTGASLVADLEPCERPYVGREEGKVLRVHLRCSLVTAFLGQQRTECLAHRDQPAVRLVVGQGIEPDARRRCCGLKKDRV